MFALFSVIVHAVTVNLSPSISHIFPQHDYQRVYMHAVHTAENEITSGEANQPRRKVRFKADGGFWEVFFGHEWWGDYCALRCNSYNHFSEPTAACVQGYGGMLEVDLGDPVCPLPV